MKGYASDSSAPWHAKVVGWIPLPDPVAWLIPTAVIICPLESSALLMTWVVGLGLVVLGYFVIPLGTIHRKMAHVKYKHIQTFSKHLEDAFAKITTEPTPENVAGSKS